MTKQCMGCGATLQYDQPENLGYTPKPDALLCQRCFRIRHYDDVMISMQQGLDNQKILGAIAQMDALILWVVDVFDLEANVVHGINRHLAGKNIVLVATKRDLLPDNLGNEKLSKFIFRRMKQLDINIQGLVITGDLHQFNAKNNASVEEIRRAIHHYRESGNVVVMGMANAGKSTMLNALLGIENHLTTSRYPGTTLDLLAQEYEGYTLYDTPGLTRVDSLLTQIQPKLLKTIIPYKQLKARNYQLKEDQSLAIGGLVRLDLFGCEQATAVCYFNAALPVHRSKAEKADALWENHLNGLLAPSLDTQSSDMKSYDFHAFKDNKKMDVVIHGLGFFTLSGKIDRVRVYVNKAVNITFREAMM
ncbi:MAG: ribosome biogenesis GTPase YqeH [Erysipelotrichaceae bacterium]